eukprot:3853732-Rhodomonas_salina.5
MITSVVVVFFIRAQLGCARFEAIDMPVMPRENEELENGNVEEAALWMLPVFVVIGVFMLCALNFCVRNYVMKLLVKVTESSVREEQKKRQGLRERFGFKNKKKDGENTAQGQKPEPVSGAEPVSGTANGSGTVPAKGPTAAGDIVNVIPGPTGQTQPQQPQAPVPSTAAPAPDDGLVSA